MVDFIEVRVKATGQLQTIPEDWMDSPVLGQQFELVEREEQLPVPTEDSKVKDIDAYAEQNGIDLSEAKTKADKLALVLATVPEPEPAPNPDVQTVLGESMTDNPRPALNEPTETPTAGAEEN